MFRRYSSILKLLLSAVFFISTVHILTSKNYSHLDLPLPPVKLPENARKRHGFTNSTNKLIGLSTHESHFYLNNERFRIFSGEFHYFRVPRTHWRHRLSLLKYAGFNTVSTYIPWNAHEPRRGEFDFTEMLDLKEFIELIVELDL